LLEPIGETGAKGIARTPSRSHCNCRSIGGAKISFVSSRVITLFQSCKLANYLSRGDALRACPGFNIRAFGAGQTLQGKRFKNNNHHKTSTEKARPPNTPPATNLDLISDSHYDAQLYSSPYKQENVHKMPVSFEDRVKLPDDVLISSLQEESVILNLDTERYFGLDDVGTRMLSVLTTSASIEEAYNLLREEYEVDDDVLKQDLLALVDQLVDQGLIEISNQ